MRPIGTTVLGVDGPRGNGNKEALHIPQNYWIIGASTLDAV